MMAEAEGGLTVLSLAVCGDHVDVLAKLVAAGVTLPTDPPSYEEAVKGL